MTSHSNISTGEVKPSPLDALLEFARESISTEERRVALTSLINGKILPKLADHPDVAKGREWLLLATRNTDDPRMQLMAIAETIRLGQVVKRWMPSLTEQLDPIFENELPPIQLLADADDRLNLARACSLFKAEWIPAYLSRSISEEDTGEKARAELMEALLQRQETLADAFRLLTANFQQLRPATEIPGDTMARRLTRTLIVLRDVLADSELDSGEDLGKALYALVSSPLSSAGRPQDEKARLDLVAQTILTVHDIVRSRISVVADPEMYRVVSYCRQLFENKSWPSELKKNLDRLVTDVCEALVLLGRQGQCDQSLLEQLEVLSNHPERARVIAKNLSSRHPELNEDVRYWLENWRRRAGKSSADSMSEQALSNSDASVGLVLQSARSIRASGERLGERLLSNLEIFEPTLLPATTGLLDQLKVLAVQVEQLAALRNLDLLGNVGDEIESSPKYFEAIGGTPQQKMVVRQPAVVKKREDGAVGEVVLKGIAE